MSGSQRRRVVVVTGASAGVGRAVAREFARQGAAIGLLSRGELGLEGAREDVDAAGGIGLPIPTDVSDAAAVEAAATRVEKELGPIDVWVNNAMATVFGPFHKISADEFRRVTEVCYLGTVHGTMSALARMIPRDRGSIVQVGSALAYRGIPLQSAYCGAKHAIQGFTESVRTELIHDGRRIRLSMVQLPAMNTPQFRWSRSKMKRKAQPVPPIFQPEVAARAVAYAADSDRRQVQVGGNTPVVVWGNKLFPTAGDHYLANTGYDSQQTDEPEDPDRPDNLFDPVEGDRGARGEFGDRAKDDSVQTWLNTHPKEVGLGALALVGGLALVTALTRE